MEHTIKYAENGITVSTEDLPNKNFPLEIFCRMVYNAILQGNTKEKAINAFKVRLEESRSYGGFVWSESKEGCDFWRNIIRASKFEVYYDEYPECKGIYIIENENKIPSFTAEMPTDIKQTIIKTAARLNRLEDIYTTNIKGLFTWDSTPQGFGFWEKIYKKYVTKQLEIEQEETTVYKSYNDLLGKTLKKSDQVYFNNEKYIVNNSFIGSQEHINNDRIFEELSISKYSFCSKLYGYDTSTGSWPYCKIDDYEALTRVCLELFRIIEKKKDKDSISIPKIAYKQTINKYEKKEIKFIENEFKFNNLKKKKVRF